MSVYPQLLTGALAQFPITTRLDARTCVNSLGDGSSIRIADLDGASTVWELQYAGLTDSEAAALEQFYEACEGSLSGFTFVDPAGNLLGWSEDLSNPVWQAGPMLAVSGGANDPLGRTNAFHLSNSGNAGQGITQILNVPGSYVYTFSVYAQAPVPSTLTLTIGNSTQTFSVGPRWNRFAFTSTVDAAANSVAFAIEGTPGAMTIFGPQVEAQPAASAYQTGVAGGVYVNARFLDDGLMRTSTAPNENNFTVKITYVNHI